MTMDIVLSVYYILMNFWIKIRFKREFEFVYHLVSVNLSYFSLSSGMSGKAGEALIKVKG